MHCLSCRKCFSLSLVSPGHQSNNGPYIFDIWRVPNCHLLPVGMIEGCKRIAQEVEVMVIRKQNRSTFPSILPTFVFKSERRRKPSAMRFFHFRTHPFFEFRQRLSKCQRSSLESRLLLAKSRPLNRYHPVSALATLQS